jgi:hypothetical protein
MYRSTNISKPTTAGLEAKIAFIKKERAVRPSEIEDTKEEIRSRKSRGNKKS